MRLHYQRTPAGNFGDDLNPWLWSTLLGDVLDDDPAALFLGIGTIIRNIDAPGERHVLGAGLGFHPLDAGDGARDRWRFHAVRGPLTAARLGLDPRLAITDPALLVRRLPFVAASLRAGRPASLDPRGPRRHHAAYMPHHASAAEGDWRAIAAAAGLAYIDPGAGPMRVLSEIAASELVVTEAMHGAIVADALGIPWVPVKVYPWIQDFKWRDWCASVDLEHRFEVPALDACEWRPSPPMSPLKRAGRWVKRAAAVTFLMRAQRAAPRLSRAAVRDRLEDRLLDQVERFRAQRASL